MCKLECSSCGRQFASEDMVRLWDGHDYCTKCVDADRPGLVDYARGHPILEDRIPPGWRSGLPVAFLSTAIAVAAFMSLAILAAEDLATGIVTALCLAALAILVGLSSDLWFLWLGERKRPTVQIKDGQVSILRRAWGALPIRHRWEYSLNECTWSIGLVQSDRRLFMSHASSTNRVVLLTFSRRRLGCFKKKQVVPCGWTPEMRTIWIRFLRLAKIPEA